MFSLKTLFGNNFKLRLIARMKRTPTYLCPEFPISVTTDHGNLRASNTRLVSSSSESHNLTWLSLVAEGLCSFWKLWESPFPVLFQLPGHLSCGSVLHLHSEGLCAAAMSGSLPMRPCGYPEPTWITQATVPFEVCWSAAVILLHNVGC